MWLFFTYWLIGVIPALYCLVLDHRAIAAHYGPLKPKTTAIYVVWSMTVTALAWPFELRIYRRKAVRLFRAKLLPRLYRERSEQRYLDHVCPACTGEVHNLPSAPGWYDSKQCIPCRIIWDDAHPMGHIRGVMQ